MTYYKNIYLFYEKNLKFVIYVKLCNLLNIVNKLPIHTLSY